jgi:hypothetical protein
VYLGKGDGTFNTPQHYDAYDGNLSIALGDLNGDGIADLVAFGSKVLAETCTSH